MFNAITDRQKTLTNEPFSEEELIAIIQNLIL